MAYENGALDATLAAAAGNDPALLAELRGAFVESLGLHVDLLRRARCDGNWNVAAMRLKGLAASFHAERLIGLAEEALEAAPGEPVVIRKLERFLTEFNTSES
ncbi:MAG: Hpt domain-containing protein [Novosphingobium sp.]|nr:Hpt domain-containing protein [Novosphingobium sp.]MBO9603784.1 Hpt domain-containing protein [Novosphingobium sp.]